MYNKSTLQVIKVYVYMKKWSGHTLFLMKVQDGSLPSSLRDLFIQRISISSKCGDRKEEPCHISCN